MKIHTHPYYAVVASFSHSPTANVPSSPPALLYYKLCNCMFAGVLLLSSPLPSCIILKSSELSLISWGMYGLLILFIHKETKNQRDQVICLQSHANYSSVRSIWPRVHALPELHSPDIQLPVLPANGKNRGAQSGRKHLGLKIGNVSSGHDSLMFGESLFSLFLFVT